MSGSIRSAVVAALLVVACGSDERPSTLQEPPDIIEDSGTPTHVPPPPEDAGCAEGKEGCPCDTPGATFDCGMVKRVSGSYVSCSPGTATCSTGLVWGACLGDQVAHQVIDQATAQ